MMDDSSAPSVFLVFRLILIIQELSKEKKRTLFSVAGRTVYGCTHVFIALWKPQICLGDERTIKADPELKQGQN